MGIDRRTLLISAAAVAGGIGVGVLAERRGWWTPAIIGTPDPDAALTRVVRSSEAALIKAYDAALASSPLTVTAANAERLQAFRDQHADHLAALGGRQDDIDDAPGPGEPDPDDPESSPTLPPLPGDDTALPGYLADAEQQHVMLLSTGVRIATGGELARLLGLIAASETTHVVGWSRG